MFAGALSTLRAATIASASFFPHNATRRGALAMARWPTVRAYAPQQLGPIHVLEKKWWNLIVAGKKDLEMRPEALTPMKRHVGRSGELWGTVTLGQAFEIKTDEHWRALRSRHQVGTDARMHKREMAHPVIAAEVFEATIPYELLPGQVGTARYRSAGTAAVAAGQGRPARKRPAAAAPAPARKGRRWTCGVLQEAEGASHVSS